MIIEVYGTPTCPNCDQVKSYLDGINYTYIYSTIGKDVMKEDVEEKLGRSIRSVPIIIADDKEVTLLELKSAIAAGIGGISGGAALGEVAGGTLELALDYAGNTIGDVLGGVGDVLSGIDLDL